MTFSSNLRIKIFKKASLVRNFEEEVINNVKNKKIKESLLELTKVFKKK